MNTSEIGIAMSIFRYMENYIKIKLSSLISIMNNVQEDP